MNIPYQHSVQRTDEADPDDYYATDPKAALALLKVEPGLDNIWEPACGAGHLSKVFELKGKLGLASDLRDRGCIGAAVQDFFKCNGVWHGDIATNPPYSVVNDFVLHALDLAQDGRLVCMLLPLTFLESQRRYERIFSKFPPSRIYVFSKRVVTVRGGDFEQFCGSGMKAFAWFVWHKGWYGDPTIKWIPEDIYD